MKFNDRKKSKKTGKNFKREGAKKFPGWPEYIPLRVNFEHPVRAPGYYRHKDIPLFSADMLDRPEMTVGQVHDVHVVPVAGTVRRLQLRFLFLDSGVEKEVFSLYSFQLF